MRKLITVISIIGIIALIFAGCRATNTTEIQKQDTAVQQPDTGKKAAGQALAEQETAEAKTDTEQVPQTAADEQQQTEEQKAQDIIASIKSGTADIASVQPVSQTKPVTQVKTSTQVKATTQAKTTTQVRTTAQTKATVQAKTSTQTKTAAELENHLINLVLSQRKLQKLPSIPRKKELDDAAAYMARTGDLPSDFSNKYKSSSSFCIYVYKMLQSEVDKNFAAYKPDLMKDATAYGAGYYRDKNALIICFIQAKEAKREQVQQPVSKEGKHEQPAQQGSEQQNFPPQKIFAVKPGRCTDMEKFIQSIIKAPRDAELDKAALENAKEYALSNGTKKDFIEARDSEYEVVHYKYGISLFKEDPEKLVGIMADKLEINPVKYGVGAYATSTYVSIWVIEYLPRS